MARSLLVSGGVSTLANDNGTTARGDAPLIDASAVLFSAMRATFWATGEDYLQRVVRALADGLHRTAVIAEYVTPTAGPDVPRALGLWVARPGDTGVTFSF